MIFVDDKQQEHDRSTKGHATNTRITSTTRHKKTLQYELYQCKNKNSAALIARSDQGSMALTWMKP